MSHSGKALLDILETYPRDELFQMSVDELLPVADGGPAPAGTPADAAVHCAGTSTAASCPAWSSCRATATRRRCANGCRTILRSTMGPTRSTTPRGHRVGARAAALRRPRGPGGDAARLRRVEPRGSPSPRPPARGPTTSPTHARAVRRGDGCPAGSPIRHGVSRGLQGGLRAGRRCADVRRVEALDGSDRSRCPLLAGRGRPGEARFKVFRRRDAAEPVGRAAGAVSAGRRGGRRAALPARDRSPATPGSTTSACVTAKALPAGSRELFQDAFMAVWDALAESDGFNALVLEARLTWRQVVDPARLREVPAPRRLRRSARTTSELHCSANVPIARLLVQLFEARFDPAIDRRPGTPARPRSRRDHVGARPGGEPGRGPDPAQLPGRRLRHAAHELLPAARRRQAEVLPVAQARPAADPGAAGAAPALRDLRLLAAGRGRAPALRAGRPRRAALVGPPRGLPHRDARAW